MSVIPLTVFFSLLLAALFVVLFAREQRRRPFASPERDSLLPLADEVPLVKGGPGLRADPMDRVSFSPTAAPVQERACACRTGRRARCTDCQRRLDEQEPAYF